MITSSRQSILFLAILIHTKFASGQTNKDNLQWSASRKLTVDDFMIKTHPLESTSSFAQFAVDYHVKGFDFLTKNFNKKVNNFMIRSASWIDTTTNVDRSLKYQQTLFDLCEIYTRQFRKSLRENRKKIANGTDIASELNNKIMTDFAKRRIEYDDETDFGSDSSKQKEWEDEIQKELLELNDFSFEN
jgi:hypothetical protein